MLVGDADAQKAVLAQVDIVLGREAGVAVVGSGARREASPAEMAGERVEARFLMAEPEGCRIKQGYVDVDGVEVQQDTTNTKYGLLAGVVLSLIRPKLP